MKIPYGTSDFGEIRSGGFFYVDKTPFLAVLERADVGYRHLLFLRPRRFGKSTLLSMLEHYYDLGRKERFDELFRGLWVHEHPTPARNAHLVLPFDFSRVSTDGGPDGLRRTFFQAVRSRVTAFLIRYRDLAPQLGDVYAQLGEYQDADALIGQVLDVLSTTPYKAYVLIDEYDHFTNRLLASGSEDLYDSIITKTGFVRTFYATLKSATGTGAVARIFMTGVTPLMLDDLSSGFNIASNVSLDPDLNTLAGFTREDVERAVDEHLAAHPELVASPELHDRAALLDVLERYYDGYRFSHGASERVFNSDMVLYFLSQVVRMRGYPGDMLDPNVRTEYRHLQRIGMLSGTAAVERRALLSRILSDGHIRSDLVRQFGVESLSSNEPFLSLLHYLGMLTLRAVPEDAIGYDLEIPNRVIRELQWEHLALMLKEQSEVDVDVDALKAALAAMAVEGDIAPFLDLFHAEVLKRLGVKDTRGLDEKALKLLLMMYASLGRAFHPLSEKEFAQGYCDLFLGAARNVAGARYSWLLELKYLKAGAKPSQIEKAFAEAEAQVARYASDGALLPLLLGGRELRAGMIVFVGTKRPLFRPWPPMSGAKRPAKVSAKASSSPPPPRSARPPRSPRARARRGSPS